VFVVADPEHRTCTSWICTIQDIIGNLPAWFRTSENLPWRKSGQQISGKKW